MGDDNDDDDMVDDAFNNENYGLFDHNMHDMIGDVFDCHGSNEGSSGLNEEVKTFFKLIEEAGQPLYLDCEELSELSFVIEMYHLKWLYRVTDRAFDAFVKLFERALPKDLTLLDSFNKMRSIIK